VAAICNSSEFRRLFGVLVLATACESASQPAAVPADASSEREDASSTEKDAGDVEQEEDSGSPGRDAETPLDYPSGQVVVCTGKCPIGPCDDDQTFTELPPCQGTYPERIDQQFAYCPAGHTGSYCLEVVGADGGDTDFFVVHCSLKGLQIDACAGDCRADNGDLSCL
jgi:hypothetical protein